MRKTSFLSLVAAASLLASSAAASTAPSQAAFTVELRGYVPVICRATLDASQAPSQAGVVSLGTLSEICNNPGGYQVWVDYSPQLASATLMVDGRSVPLSSSGSTMISASSGAAIAAHDLAIDLPTSGVAGSLSVRVVTL
jgi:hypothetical protein